jgi:Tfp pilus assembly protein PilV
MVPARLKNEQGMGLIELLIAVTVLQIALLAIIGAFGAGAVAMGRAAHINTAAILADQQLELYRSMPYDAVGLDTAGAPTTGTYVADTTVCPASQSPVCGNTPPRNNSNTSAWSCTATSGTTSVSTYFSANGVNPCSAHRIVSGASSPDGRTYYVDSYVSFTTPTNERAVKVVSVVVRDGTTTSEMAKEVTSFDCSTGNAANAAPC